MKTLELPLSVKDISIDGAAYPQVHEEVCRRVNCHDELMAALRLAEGEMVTLVARLTPTYAKNINAALGVIRVALQKGGAQ